MKERIGAQLPSRRICDEVFACRLPGSQVNEIGFTGLPARIRSEIGRKSDCGIALQIIHPDCSYTIVGENLAFETIHLQDRNDKNKYMGEGQVYIENIDDELYIPVVGYTFTSRQFRRRGVGTRRLAVMNAVTKILYDESIFSSTSPRLGQKALWEKLVEEELAEMHQYNGIKRFKFL